MLSSYRLGDLVLRYLFTELFGYYDDYGKM